MFERNKFNQSKKEQIMVLDEILKYQKKDGELLKIEKTISGSKSKQVVNQMVEIVKNAQQKLKTIEKESEKLLTEFNELNALVNEQNEELDKLLKQKLETKTENELKDIEKKIKDITTNILLVQKKTKKISQDIDFAIKDFEQTRNEGSVAKQKHQKAMLAYSQLNNESKEKIEKLQKELDALEKKVDPKLLKKYKTMREDKKFPVFVPLLNNSCGGCAMELAMSKKHVLEEKGVLECENCHRIIYTQD